MTKIQSQRYSQGMKTRRQVLGDRYVDQAEQAKTDFNGAFQEMIAEAAWGHVWSSDQLTKRERSMITIALLATLGYDDELAMHVKATVKTGASANDVREALMHVAIYAGVPAANHAFKIAARALFDENKEETVE